MYCVTDIIWNEKSFRKLSPSAHSQHHRDDLVEDILRPLRNERCACRVLQPVYLNDL